MIVVCLCLCVLVVGWLGFCLLFVSLFFFGDGVAFLLFLLSMGIFVCMFVNFVVVVVVGLGEAVCFRVGGLFACLLACLFACLLACLLACFACSVNF